MYICLPVHVYMFVRPCIYVCQAMYICLPVHVYMFVRPCIYVCQAMYICLSVHVYVCQAMYICLSGHVYMFVRSCIYVCQAMYICLSLSSTRRKGTLRRYQGPNCSPQSRKVVTTTVVGHDRQRARGVLFNDPDNCQITQNRW